MTRAVEERLRRKKRRMSNDAPAKPLGARNLATVAEVCAYLKINPRTLYRYIDQGKIKAYRLTRSKLMIDMDSVEEFVASNADSRAKKTA